MGYRAGEYEKGSDKLYIENSETNTPLIWGDFGIRKVVINGDFRAIAASIPSDVRLKKSIDPLQSCLDKMLVLQGVSFEWKIDEYPDMGFREGKQIGLIAQDVEHVLPELVSEDGNGYKSVSYSKLTAVLVEAVKELKNENLRQKEVIEKQQRQFQKQQAEIDELRLMIEKLKS